MKCPSCKNNLSPYKHESVEFDFCDSGCKGLWLDHGELAEYISEHKESMPFFERDISKGKKTSLKCPKCDDETLYQHHFIEENDIDLDLCPKCLGVWLDFKELGKVKKISSSKGLGGKICVAKEHLESKGLVILK